VIWVKALCVAMGLEEENWQEENWDDSEDEDNFED
jgi:hypothetical protein